MSTQAQPEITPRESAAELTLLGKRLEILRIERGVSKQHLARHAGTSRQQLWRVMTGKSELTNSLRERLASALSIEPSSLTSNAGVSTQSFAIGFGSTSTSAARDLPSFTIADYLTHAELITATLCTLPTGDSGRRLKRALLNTLEDLAVETSQALPPEYSEIHRRVLAGEL